MAFCIQTYLSMKTWTAQAFRQPTVEWQWATIQPWCSWNWFYSDRICRRRWKECLKLCACHGSCPLCLDRLWNRFDRKVENSCSPKGWHWMWWENRSSWENRWWRQIFLSWAKEMDGLEISSTIKMMNNFRSRHLPSLIDWCDKDARLTNKNRDDHGRLVILKLWMEKKILSK